MRRGLARPSAVTDEMQMTKQKRDANNVTATLRLLEKNQEFEAVAALERRASALFLKRIEGLADDCEAGNSTCQTPVTPPYHLLENGLFVFRSTSSKLMRRS
ncbi:hypothetical protein BDR06DRAFT_1015648 [Suillus hirtellus]|nr:hypothetical protein BDR06DRAFT_1015648 [Suillus hirtellus]